MSKFNKADTDAVALFHHKYLSGKRLHYPIPIHRGHGNRFDVYARQYFCSGNSWILDVDGPAPMSLLPGQQINPGTYDEVFDPPAQSGLPLVRHLSSLAQKSVGLPPPGHSQPAPQLEQSVTKRKREDQDDSIDPALLGL